MNSHLSSGARIIFPYLTAYGLESQRDGYMELPYKVIDASLGVSVQCVVAWLADLEKHKFVKNSYYVDDSMPDSIIFRWQYPYDVEENVRKLQEET